MRSMSSDERWEAGIIIPHVPVTYHGRNIANHLAPMPLFVFHAFKTDWQLSVAV